MTGAGEAQSLQAVKASGDLLPALQVPPPMVGRDFLRAEDQKGCWMIDKILVGLRP